MKMATKENLIVSALKGTMYKKGGKIFLKIYCLKATQKDFFLHYGPTQKRDIFFFFSAQKLSAEDNCDINYTFKEIKYLTELLEMIKRKGGKENETNQK